MSVRAVILWPHIGCILDSLIGDRSKLGMTPSHGAAILTDTLVKLVQRPLPRYGAQSIIVLFLVQQPGPSIAVGTTIGRMAPMGSALRSGLVS